MKYLYTVSLVAGESMGAAQRSMPSLWRMRVAMPLRCRANVSLLSNVTAVYLCGLLLLTLTARWSFAE